MKELSSRHGSIIHSIHPGTLRSDVPPGSLHNGNIHSPPMTVLATTLGQRYTNGQVHLTLERENEPVREKTNNLGSDQLRHKPGCAVTEDGKRLEISDLGRMGLYYRVATTKELISFAVTAKLICAFVFAYAECWFSHAQAQIILSKCIIIHRTRLLL